MKIYAIRFLIVLACAFLLHTIFLTYLEYTTRIAINTVIKAMAGQ